MSCNLKGPSQSPSLHFLYPVSYTTDAIPSYTWHATYHCHYMAISPAIPFLCFVCCHVMWWQGRWVRKDPAVFVLSGSVLHNYCTSVICVVPYGLGYQCLILVVFFFSCLHLHPASYTLSTGHKSMKLDIRNFSFVEQEKSWISCFVLYCPACMRSCFSMSRTVNGYV